MEVQVLQAAPELRGRAVYGEEERRERVGDAVPAHMLGLYPCERAVSNASDSSILYCACAPSSACAPGVGVRHTHTDTPTNAL